MKRPLHPHSTVQEVIKAAVAGEQYVSIAERLHMHRRQVQGIVFRHATEAQIAAIRAARAKRIAIRDAIPPWEKVKQMALEGLLSSEIAQQLGAKLQNVTRQIETKCTPQEYWQIRCARRDRREAGVDRLDAAYAEIEKVRAKRQGGQVIQCKQCGADAEVMPADGRCVKCISGRMTADTLPAGGAA